jgi:hypothetical protein
VNWEHTPELVHRMYVTVPVESVPEYEAHTTASDETPTEELLLEPPVAKLPPVAALPPVLALPPVPIGDVPPVARDPPAPDRPPTPAPAVLDAPAPPLPEFVVGANDVSSFAQAARSKDMAKGATVLAIELI